MKFELEVYQGWMGCDPSTEPIALCKVAVNDMYEMILGHGCSSGIATEHPSEYVRHKRENFVSVGRRIQKKPASKNPTISPDVLGREIVVPRLASLGTTPSQGTRHALASV